MRNAMVEHELCDRIRMRATFASAAVFRTLISVCWPITRSGEVILETFHVGDSTICKIHEMDLNGFTLRQLLPEMDDELAERHPNRQEVNRER